jgi:hypothetical protein
MVAKIINQTFDSNPMKIKTINQVNVAFLDNYSQNIDLVGNWVQYSDLIYILQPSTDSRIPTIYSDSAYFATLRSMSKNEILRSQKINPNYITSTCTACLFENSKGEVISSITQDSTAHIFETQGDIN